MQWRGRRESGNIEDRRGIGGRHVAMGGGGLIVIVVAIVWALLGGNPDTVLQQGSSLSPVTSSYSTGASGGSTNTTEDQLRQFVGVVLADTEDVWTQQFQKMGKTYVKPTLVLYTGTVQTPGGLASSSTGPFYSPADQKVYLDMSFFQELSSKYQAPGDFADAYVIAHEVGHHVQKLLGIMDQVAAAEAGASATEKNAHYEQSVLGAIQPGDIEEALAAATAIGDDRLQKEAQGYVVPDTFTHGTSAQRVRWFKLGYDTGDISQGDTFKASSL